MPWGRWLAAPAAALSALVEIGYEGLVAGELSRHAHAAHETGPPAIEVLRRREGVEGSTSWPWGRFSWAIRRSVAFIRDPTGGSMPAPSSPSVGPSVTSPTTEIGCMSTCWFCEWENAGS